MTLVKVKQGCALETLTLWWQCEPGATHAVFDSFKVSHTPSCQAQPQSVQSPQALSLSTDLDCETLYIRVLPKRPQPSGMSRDTWGPVEVPHGVDSDMSTCRPALLVLQSALGMGNPLCWQPSACHPTLYTASW